MENPFLGPITGFAGQRTPDTEPTIPTETLDERVRRLEAEYREAIIRVEADQARVNDSRAERKRAHERLLAARAEQIT